MFCVNSPVMLEGGEGSGQDTGGAEKEKVSSLLFSSAAIFVDSCYCHNYV